MSVRLLTIEPIEGKAFYEEDGNVFQIRPLYGRDTYFPVSRSQMKLVVERENYERIDRDFPNISEAIKFIRKAYIDLRTKQGLQNPDDDQLKQVVQKADDTVLIPFIQKAINEWLPNGQIERARKLYDDVSQISDLNSRGKLVEPISILAKRIEEFSISNINSRERVIVVNEADIEAIYRRKFPALARKLYFKRERLFSVQARARQTKGCRMVPCEI